MSTKNRTPRQRSIYTVKKETYAAKIETLRRKEVRKDKYLTNTARKES